MTRIIRWKQNRNVLRVSGKEERRKMKEKDER